MATYDEDNSLLPYLKRPGIFTRPFFHARRVFVLLGLFIRRQMVEAKPVHHANKANAIGFGDVGIGFDVAALAGHLLLGQ